MNYFVAVHVIAVVCWFAGLFYLPRLFVYHAASPHEVVRAQFKVMEYKLYWYIMMPAMALSLLTGMCLFVLYVAQPHVHVGWLWLKLLLVLLLVSYHFFCGYCVRIFKADENIYSERFYRIFNEVPSVLLIAIIFLVVLQPF